MSKYKINGLVAKVPYEVSLKPTDEYNGRRRKYKLLNDFVFIISYKGGLEEITVPRGFKTDLATLPIFTQIILGNRDDYLQEAIIHDFLCEQNLPRWVSNAKMRTLMLILGRPRWKRAAVWWGLILFGYRSPISKMWSKITGYWKKG